MPDDIKWPQKVTRYRIQCPFQRLLIAKHESQIDWSGHRIESGEALDRYLREVMLPGLKDCITPDHPKSHYCKSIHLERMLANPAPHINEARQIRQREGMKPPGSSCWGTSTSTRKSILRAGGATSWRKPLSMHSTRPFSI